MNSPQSLASGQIPVAGTAFFALFLVFSGALKWELGAFFAPIEGLEVGAEVAAVPLRTLTGDESLDLQHLTSKSGDVTIVNFWGAWCVPCRLEMPLLADLHAAEEGISVLSINLDDGAEGLEARDAYLNDHPQPFPILAGRLDDVTEFYDVAALPFSIVVDRDGRILEWKSGAYASIELEARRDTWLQ